MIARSLIRNRRLLDVQFPLKSSLRIERLISSPESIFPRSFSSISKSETDSERLLVVGSGVAGCSAALVAAEKYRIPVSLVCAGSQLVDCNSYWAQGGIIYRNYDPEAQDTPESLVADVHRAGAGLCEDDAVRKVAIEGPERVRELLLDDRKEQVFANVPFNRDENGDLLYCLEASHSAARILYYADQSGKAITEHITAAAAAHPLVNVVSNTVVTDLILSDSGVCVGIEMLNCETGVQREQLSNKGVVLASGGLGGIFEHTTNPAGFNALGSSVGLALRADAECADLEYVQFHPTSLYIPGEARFLLSEALRGEGAILRDANGRAFAKDFHPDGELAPRDIVARGVFEWGGKDTGGAGHNVFLDITHRDADWLNSRFPAIQSHLKKRGLDLTTDMLPVTPASHYTCGGVTTDLHGRTNIPGLYAAGEAARTGLHGGNRLASTSLLEGLVFGASVSDFVASEEGKEIQNTTIESIANLGETGFAERNQNNGVVSSDVSQKNTEEATSLLLKLRRTMWDKVGVVRTPAGTQDAIEILGSIKHDACELFDKSPSLETAALRDAAFSGEAVANAASRNRTSAGAHFIDAENVDNIETLKQECG